MTRRTTTLFALIACLALSSPVSAETGGPDAAGYTYIDSADVGNPNAPVFAFVPLVGGTNVPASAGGNLADQDNAFSTAQPLGFTFNFYGTNFADVFVGSNGYLTFGAGSVDQASDPIPDTGNPNNLIALNWNNLDPSASLTDSIRFLAGGVAPNRTFTVEFLDVPHFGGGATPVRIQVTLSETTNEILMQIDDATADGSRTAIGIENAGGTTGLQYAFSEGVGTIVNNVAIRFRPVATAPIPRCLGDGPDAGGYSFVDNTVTGSVLAPVFNLTPLVGGTAITSPDIDGLGTPGLLQDSDDGVSDPLNLGFTFTYYGVPFTQVFVGANGQMTFGSGSTDRTPDFAPDTSTPNDIIAFAWNGLDASASATDTIRFLAAGVAPNRTFTIEFLDVPHFGGAAPPIRAQVTLFEANNEILMQLDDVSADGSFTGVLIENGTGTIGLNYAYSRVTGLIVNDRAVLFTQRDALPPAAVADLAASNPTATTVDLTWSEPGDDCLAGNLVAPASADVRWSVTPILTQADFVLAIPVVGPVPTGPPGNPVALTVTGLPGDTTVFFAVEYLDEVGNRALLSNVASLATLDLVPPAPVTDLRITNIAGTMVTVAWTNTGDNGLVGTAATVDIRFRLDGCLALVAGNFVGPVAPPFVDPAGEPAPTAAGTTQTFTFDVGAPFTTFDVGMVVRDEVPNTSAVSNQPVCGTTGAPMWQPPIVGSDTGGGVSNTIAGSVDPCMAVNPLTFQPGVVWTDRDPVGGDLEIFMRESDGAAFQELALSGSGGGVSVNATPSQYSDIEYDATGRPVVAWEDQDGASGDTDVFVRRFEGGAWAELAGSATGSGVSANGTSSTRPSVAVNPLTGQPGVVWVDFQFGDFEIFFREFDGAAWQQFAGSGGNQGVSNDTGVSQQPSLEYDALGRPVIAWADNSSGNYEVYLRRLNAGVWEELAGSGTGGGVSRSSTQASQNPAVQIGSGNNPCVVWQEHLSDGNVEIHGRRFNGAAWVDFGPGSAASGGISVTPGRSITPALCAHPGIPDVFLCVWADFSHVPGNSEIYGKWYQNGQWREVGTFSARFGGISNTAGHSLSPCCGIANGATPVAYVSWQEESGGNYEVFVRSLLLVGNVSDSNQEFVVGGGTGGRGEYRVFGNGTTLPLPYAALDLRVVPFLPAAYNANVGTLHPACGDVDGDGNDEVIVGQGSFPGGNGGFVAVIRDHSGRYDQLAMLRMPWTAYNNANGAVYPACGDIDGDGRDEIVMGQGTYAPGGYAAIVDDQIGLFAFQRWVRLAYPSYNSMNGEVHPACGDVDNDQRDEIVLGVGRGGNGWVQVMEDRAAGHGSIAWLRNPNLAYDRANGTTWPACGNTTGGNGAEVVVGPGTGGSGQLHIFGDRASGFARIGGLQFPWGVYNSSVGEVRPAVGNLDPDRPLEVVGGSGPFPGNNTGGWLFVFNDVTTGAAAGGAWVRYVNTNGTYNSTNGETFPAAGQLR